MKGGAIARIREPPNDLRGIIMSHQHCNYPPQNQPYFNQQPGYYSLQQPGYYPPPQTVYVQQPPNRSTANSGLCAALLAGLCCGYCVENCCEEMCCCCCDC
ncbi:hypothetical protein Q1695_004697 [Nippostrongylus brasiliensis]|nr:hypothetical protein Q1695_004697 [Nippostrongylus brasiliensis]